MKHLITGGAGFLGYHLGAALARRGDVVHLVDDLSRGTIDADLKALLAAPNVRLIEADVTDEHCHDAWDDDYDSVVHLAGIVGVRRVLADPFRVLAVNSRAVLNLLEWFATSRSKKFVFSSTSEVYAWTMAFHPLPIPTPEEVPLAVDRVDNPRAVYAISKVLGEMAVVNACAASGRPYAVLRYHNVYGPRMGMEHVIPELWQRIRAGQQPLAVFSPDDRRAFCYVDDAIDATVRLIATDTPSGMFNVGNDREEVSMRNLAALLLDLEGVADRSISDAGSPGASIGRRCPNISKLVRETGYQPATVLREGVRRTAAWYRNNAAAPSAPAGTRST